MSLKETVIKLMCVVAMLCCFMQTASADWYDDIKPNSTWVEIKGEKFVADTFMGVPALYNENDNSYYHCGELVIRFYKEAYNLEIYPYTDDTPTSLTEGYKFVTTKTPQKGDIIFVSKEMRGSSQDHWAIVKDYSDGYITLFEQNTIWNGQAGVERKLKCPSDSYYIFTPVSTGAAPAPSLGAAGTQETPSSPSQNMKPVEFSTAPATEPETKVETTKSEVTEPTTDKPTQIETTKPTATTTVPTTKPTTTKPVTTVAATTVEATTQAVTEESTTAVALTELNTTQKQENTVAESTTASVKTENNKNDNVKKIMIAVGACVALVTVAAAIMVIAKKKRK